MNNTEIEMTLEEFRQYQLDKLDAFVTYWLDEHAKSPDDFPLELPEDNEALWFELFEEFEVWSWHPIKH